MSKVSEQLRAAVQRYFYLSYRYPERTKVYNPKSSKKETKTKYVANIEKREDFIKKFGQEEFNRISESDEKWNKLKDIPIPHPFMWLFRHFLMIWRHCEHDLNGNKIFRPVDITQYSECFEVKFTIEEKRLMLLMKEWASSTIIELTSKDN